MKCFSCDKEIEYIPGNQYVQLSVSEFMYGEHCYFPQEVVKNTWCSFQCLMRFIENEIYMAQRGG